jgi:lysozyme
MMPSLECATLVKLMEALELTAYPDPASPLARALRDGLKVSHRTHSGAPWTIGYGHTGPEVVPGLVWTVEQADAALVRDLAKAATGVAVGAPRAKLEQCEFDALCSFVLNVGVKAFADSTMAKMLNAGDKIGAAGQFKRWNKAQGQELEGLTRRRRAEEAMFNGADAHTAYAIGWAT